MTSRGDEVAEPNTPSGVIAGMGALGRGLGQPAYHGSTFKVTMVFGLVLVFTVVIVVAVLLIRG